METVNFKVNKDGVIKDFTLEPKLTIEDLKNTIKEEYDISSYIDIVFQIEKPMRVLGKFNVEPGNLARTFDRYELNKFGINLECIDLTFNEDKCYKPPRIQNRRLDLNKYTVGEVGKVKNSDVFNINSEKDFPSLG